jgi:hypothetical protein
MSSRRTKKKGEETTRTASGRSSTHDRDGGAPAFLVRLRASDGDEQAILALCNVGDIERDQLGAAEAAGEAEQQQGAIAQGRDATVADCGHRDQQVGGCRGFPARRGPHGSSDDGRLAAEMEQNGQYGAVISHGPPCGQKIGTAERMKGLVL